MDSWVPYIHPFVFICEEEGGMGKPSSSEMESHMLVRADMKWADAQV